MAFKENFTSFRPLSLLSFRHPAQKEVKNSHPEKDEEHQKEVLREFERLAAVAPHLLDDIGFRRSARLSTPGRDVWDRGGMRIALEARTGQARFLPRPGAAEQM